MSREFEKASRVPISNEISKVHRAWTELLSRGDSMGMSVRMFEPTNRNPSNIIERFSEPKRVQRNNAIFASCDKELNLGSNAKDALASLISLKEANASLHQSLAARALPMLLQLEHYTATSLLEVDALGALPLPHSTKFLALEFQRQREVVLRITDDSELLCFVSGNDNISDSQMERRRFHMWQRICSAVSDTYDSGPSLDGATGVSACLKPDAIFDRLLSVGIESINGLTAEELEIRVAFVGADSMSLATAAIAFAKVRANAHMVGKVVNILSTGTFKDLADNEFTARYQTDVFKLMTNSIADTEMLIHSLRPGSESLSDRGKLQLFASHSFAVPYERDFILNVLCGVREHLDYKIKTAG